MPTQPIDTPMSQTLNMTNITQVLFIAYLLQGNVTFLFGIGLPFSCPVPAKQLQLSVSAQLFLLYVVLTLVKTIFYHLFTHPIIFLFVWKLTQQCYSNECAAATFFKLPYRIIFAVATLNSLYIYDTESMAPIVVYAGLHYAAITDIAW